MPFKRSHIQFTGTAGDLYGYISQGRFIYRAVTSLTGERIKQDPAFEGFRRSCNRMKEASPIAAELYNKIPKEKKQYSLYRVVTGEALKMIKQGVDKARITETLYKQYIEPVLQAPAQKRVEKTSYKYTSGSLFTYGFNRSIRIRSKRRIRQMAGAMNEESINTITLRPTRYRDSLSNPPEVQSVESGPIYLGRDREYRGLKFWLIPFASLSH